MLRRDLIGSVIGTIAINKLPFIAIPVPHIVVDRDYAARWLAKAPCRELMQCQGIFINVHGDFKTTAVQSVERHREGLVFKYYDWWANQPITLNGVKLMRPDGLILSPQSFNFEHGGQFLNTGDTLRCTHRVYFEGE